MRKNKRYPHIGRIEHLVDEGATRFPERPALIYGERTWTYAELRAEMDRRAARLVEVGLTAGDVIATTESPTDDLAIAALATCRADLTLLYLAPAVPAIDRAALLDSAHAAALLTADGQADPNQPSLETLALTLPGQPRQSAVDEAARRSVLGCAESVVALIATSGTTGAIPKLVRAPHRMMTWRGPSPVWWEQRPNIFFRPKLSYFPVRLFYELLSQFGTIVFSQTLDPERMEAEMIARGATAFVGTPTSLRLLTEQSRPPMPGLALRVTRTSGMLVPQTVREAAARRYGAAILEEYGSTEGGAIMITPREGAPYGSVGKPYPGAEARIVDDVGHAVQVGEVGELIVRSPGLMLGYLENPAASEQALRGGWLWTGDLARRDEEGRYYLEGRRALRINVGGFKVAPEEVEAVLLQHPAIREAVVLAMPDVRRGEAVRAVIVPNGAPPATSELRRFCRERLAGYKVPRVFEFREELPRSPLGKVLRHLL